MWAKCIEGEENEISKNCTLGRKVVGSPLAGLNASSERERVDQRGRYPNVCYVNERKVYIYRIYIYALPVRCTANAMCEARN